MKLGPPDENFCTATNNRKQGLSKKLFFPKKKKKKEIEMSSIFECFLLTSKFFTVY